MSRPRSRRGDERVKPLPPEEPADRSGWWLKVLLTAFVVIAAVIIVYGATRNDIGPAAPTTAPSDPPEPTVTVETNPTQVTVVTRTFTVPVEP